VGDRAVWLTGRQRSHPGWFKGKTEIIVPSPAVYEVVEMEPNMKGNTPYETSNAFVRCYYHSVPGFTGIDDSEWMLRKNILGTSIKKLNNVRSYNCFFFCLAFPS
jgi:hypothetical protein